MFFGTRKCSAITFFKCPNCVPHSLIIVGESLIRKYDKYKPTFKSSITKFTSSYPTKLNLITAPSTNTYKLLKLNSTLCVILTNKLFDLQNRSVLGNHFIFLEKSLLLLLCDSLKPMRIYQIYNVILNILKGLKNKN